MPLDYSFKSRGVGTTALCMNLRRADAPNLLRFVVEPTTEPWYTLVFIYFKFIAISNIEGSQGTTYIVVVTGPTFTIFKDRLDKTNVAPITLEDEVVTAAAFSENNEVLFLGTSKGRIIFINLNECVKAVEDGIID